MQPQRKFTPPFYQCIPSFRLLLLVIIGIAIYPFIPKLPLLFFASIVVLIFIGFATTYRYRTLGNLGLLLAYILIGYLCAFAFDNRNEKSFYRNAKQAEGFIAVINDRPKEKSKTFLVPLSIISSINKNEAEQAMGKTWVYVYKQDFDTTLHKGDTILINNEWQNIAAPINDYAFNYARFLAHQNIYQQQFIAATGIKKIGSNKTPSSIDVVHQYCVSQINKYILDEDTRGVMQAMLVGEESELDPELKIAYVQTGIIHVIAISGGHIAVLFGMIAWCFSKWRSKHAQWLQYLVGIIIVWFYVLVAGAPPSAIRAAIMFSVVGIGLFTARTTQSINTIIVSAFLLLLFQPSWLYAVGFQLSVLAVLSIALFYKNISKWFYFKHRIWQSLWQVIALSIAAEILVAPVVLYYFHTFPIAILLSNVLAWLFMTMVMLLGFALLVLSPIDVLAHAIGQILSWLMQFFNKIITAINEFSPGYFTRISYNFWEMIMLLIALSAIALGATYYKHKTIQAALLLLCFISAFNIAQWWQQAHQEKLMAFAAPKQAHIEMIRGHRAIQWSDTVIDAYYNFTLKETHIALGINDTMQNPLTDTVFMMNGKRIVLLASHAPLQNDNIFPCDELIMATRPRSSTYKKVNETFQPKTITLTNAVTKGYKNLWKAACVTDGIVCHDVANGDGAIAVAH